MQSNFARALELVLAHEGGWSDHPKDPGGATNLGVTQRVYDAWRRNEGLGSRSVRDISLHEAGRIYRMQYWDRARCDDLPPGVDYATFDYCVNSGVSRAVRALQRQLDVDADAVIGEVTLAALRGFNDPHEIGDLILDYCADRMTFLKGLRHWRTFGRGWTRRVQGDREGAQVGDFGVVDHGMAMCMAAPRIDTVPAAIGAKPGEVRGLATGRVSLARSIFSRFFPIRYPHLGGPMPDDSPALAPMPIWQARSFWLAVFTLAGFLLPMAGLDMPFEPGGGADKVLEILPYVTGLLAYRERLDPQRRLTLSLT